MSFPTEHILDSQDGASRSRTMLAAASGLAPLAFEAVKWGKRAYTGYKALKAVADKAQTFRRAPAIISETCALCAALLEPMAVAEALATRHVSLRIVGPALTLAQATVAQFNALVVEPEDDDWHTWLQTGVAGVSNQSRLEALQGALTRAMTAMHLALISVSVSLEPRVAVSPFRFLRAAFQVRERVCGVGGARGAFQVRVRVMGRLG